MAIVSLKSSGVVYPLIAGQNATGVVDEMRFDNFDNHATRFIQVVGVGGGATVDVEVSQNGSDWFVEQTITLAGAGTTGVTSQGAWKFLRANVKTITATNLVAYISF